MFLEMNRSKIGKENMGTTIKIIILFTMLEYDHYKIMIVRIWLLKFDCCKNVAFEKSRKKDRQLFK